MVVIDCDGTDVALVPWPAEAVAVTELARARRPRVLLVAAASGAPDVRDPLEDWVRVPADHRDVEVRARRLARFAAAGRPSGRVDPRARPASVLVLPHGGAR